MQTIYAGRLPPGELRAAAEATLALGQKQRTCRFLADCSTLEGGHSAMDLYELVEFVCASGLDGQMREAVILPGGSRPTEDVRFWETACLNRGLNVRIFTNPAEALQWLQTEH